jgi:UDP-N-acetylglucosamine 4,6-dehydratase
MITRDDRCVEFKDHFVIKPTINFSFEADYSQNMLGERGKEKEIGFEYSSDKNDWWLSREEFKEKAKEFL